MVRLTERTACAGLLPVTVGTVALTEVAMGPVALVAPFRGQEAAVGAALGCGWPGPGEVLDGRVIWAGQGRALVCGAVPALAGLAAVTDQSDAAAVVRVEGTEAEAVLARLVPIDLRAAALPQGRTARTLVGHMTAQVTRAGPQAFDIMVLRSMAGTLVRELTEAAEAVAARQGLGG